MVRSILAVLCSNDSRLSSNSVRTGLLSFSSSDKLAISFRLCMLATITILSNTVCYVEFHSAASPCPHASLWSKSLTYVSWSGKENTIAFVVTLSHFFLPTEYNIRFRLALYLAMKIKKISPVRMKRSEPDSIVYQYFICNYYAP